MVDIDELHAAEVAARELREQSAGNSKPSSQPSDQTAASADAGEDKSDTKSAGDDNRGHRAIPEDRNGKWARNGFNDRNDSYRSRPYDNRRNPNWKQNTEFNNLPETDDRDAIVDQVGFYFHPRNLATDLHLFKALDGPKNTPVSIKHLNTFKRMQRFKPYSAVVDAIRSMENLVVVDDGTGKEGVKLKVPLVIPEAKAGDHWPQTTETLFHRYKKAFANDPSSSVYIKGFGVDKDEPNQLDLEKFFRPYGAVMVRKRRDDDNNFKGSVFIEFNKIDDQKQFLDLDPKPKWGDKELDIMSKKAYVEMKCKEKGITPDWDLTDEQRQEMRKKRRDQKFNSTGYHQANTGPRRGGFGGRGRGQGRGRRGDRNGYGRDGHGRRDRSGSRDRHYRRDRSNSRDRHDRRERDPQEDSKDTNATKRKAEDDIEAGADSKKSKIEFKHDE